MSISAVVVTEEVHKGPYHGEEGRLFAPILLRESPSLTRFLDVHTKCVPVGTDVTPFHEIVPLQMFDYGGHQHHAPLVERRYGTRISLARDHQRRIDKAYGPARIPPGILVGAGEQRAPTSVKCVDETPYGGAAAGGISQSGGRGAFVDVVQEGLHVGRHLHAPPREDVSARGTDGGRGAQGQVVDEARRGGTAVRGTLRLRMEGCSAVVVGGPARPMGGRKEAAR
mmetsp:Transcript_42960/g.84387  ORF Transcript_42960/g.84387 Transcript_42960/m.84387 type:complete len:226 (-) Transcript_42960:175-852(-)